ncbi:unannotated protein [freshwater metagenome]|uniref:Unannotated protein n=1 Tax=freshwater metagenome TaxID=449393 RepID=A0A6J7IWR5_9ZZZZ
MIRSFRSRLVAVSTGVLLTAATLGTLAPVAQAETVSGNVPATITASPTTGLVSGSTVTVSATADLNWNIYSLRARLCKSSAMIDNAGDFSPTLGGNCISGPLAANTDSDVTVNTSVGARSSATLDFNVGAGSTTFATQYDGNTTIACGVTSTTGCKLVVEMSANNLSGRVIYKSFPLTYALPNAPTGVSAVWGNAKAVVSWTASAAQTGLPAVTSYTVTSSPGGFTCTTASTSCEVSGLTNGTPYTFSVTGTSTLGTSADSTATSAVTPSSSAYVVSSTPTAGLSSGTTVAQTVTMSTGQNLYSVRTRLCKASATISNAGDFSPTLGGNCVSTPLASNTDSDVTVTTSAGSRGSASLSFKVGAGTKTFATQYDGNSTIACGTTFANRESCKLVTEISYTTALGVARVVYESTAIAFATVPAAPGAPTVAIGATGGSATASWTAPATGGSAITGYQVTATGGVSPIVFTVGASTLSQAFAGLSKTTTYTFTVKAVNGVGSSLASAGTSKLAAAVPAKPATITVGSTGNGSITVNYTAPATTVPGAPVTGYLVQAFAPLATTAADTCNNGDSILTCTLTGLTNGVKYEIRVSAKNVVGTGVSYNKVKNVIPATTPGKPSITTVTGGNGQVTVAWSAPLSNGGSAVTGYTVQAFNAAGTDAIDGKTCTPTAATGTNCIVAGLTNGTAYTFKVTAANAKGSGSASDASAAATPATVPSAPGSPQATANSLKSVTISWSAPSSNGSAITGYTVQAYTWNGSVATIVTPKKCTTTSATTCNIGGLVAGTQYKFNITATNAKGTSSAATTAAVTAKN